MGVNVLKRSSDYRSPLCSDPLPTGNPDPNRFEVKRIEQLGNYTLLLVHYYGCTNFEGNKILLMKDVSLIDIINSKHLDPHFYETSKLIARFIPNDDGWIFGMSMMGILHEMHKNNGKR